MFNFTKKHCNTLVDSNEQATEMSEEYNAAIKKIEQLEDELDQSNRIKITMFEIVKDCINSLHAVQDQLRSIVLYLEHSNKHIFELAQENRIFRSSNSEWLKRAIKIEFDILTVKDELKKIKNERDLAIKKCEILQAKLMLANRKK